MSIALIALALATSPPATDRDTSAWWATTKLLSSDAMEGRDTGSAAYERAAKVVAARLAAAGVKPAGDNGSWFQRVPMEQVALPKAGVQIAVDRTPLAFLHDINVEAALDMPTKLDAAIAFRGYCGDALGDVRGKIVVCWGTHRAGLPDAAARLKAVRGGGAAGIVTVADPGFTVEPPRWPFAYARSVWLAGSPPKREAMLITTLNVEALGRVIAGSGRDATALIAGGTAGEPLPSFDAPGRFLASFSPTRRTLTSSNVIGLLPGSDPALAKQHVVLSAHLDGYGYGEPVDGDGLYNGTLDDAAYVALLIRLAERRHGQGFHRPVLLAAFTGEEKGLLGARWFVAHPTVPLATIAADINLDQLRPIFPLDLLTVHALDDTSLGSDARAVAQDMGIAVQKDPEPERNLLRRADQWPFLQAGIPATAFVFGYRPGTPSERVYRRWYVTGYHKPQDDTAQPMDWTAASRFNSFFYRLVDRVADQPSGPSWLPGSALKP